jgi:hypothetical protein
MNITRYTNKNSIRALTHNKGISPNKTKNNTSDISAIFKFVDNVCHKSPYREFIEDPLISSQLRRPTGQVPQNRRFNKKA